MSARRFILYSLLIVLAAGLVILGIYAGMPFLAQTLVQKKFGPQLEKWGLVFHLSGMDLSKTRVTQFRFGPDLSADLAVLEYDFKGLSMPDPRRLAVTGLSITATLDRDNGLKIRGIPMPDRENDPLSPRPLLPEAFLPLLPGEVVITHSSLVLLVNHRFVRIPFDVSLELNRSDATVFGRARLYPFGQKVELEVRLDRKGGVETLVLTADDFNPAPLAPFLPKSAGPALQQPIDLAFEKTSLSQWVVRMPEFRPLGMSGPALRDIHLKVLTEQERITLMGNWEAVHAGMPQIPFVGKLLVDLEGDAPLFDLSLESQGLDELPMEFEGVALTLNRPGLAGSIKGRLDAFSGNWSLKCTGMELRQPDRSLKAGQATITSHLTGNREQGDVAVAQDLSMQLKNIRMTSGQAHARFKQAGVKGGVTWNALAGPRADLTLALSRGKVDAPAHKLAVKGINAQLPVTWPHAGGTGRFSVDEIAWDNRFRFNAAGRLVRTGFKDATIDGSIRMMDTDDIGAAFKGTAGISDTPFLRFELGSDQFRLSSTNFEDLMPELWAAEYEFDLSAVGSVALENHKLETAGVLTIHNGEFSLPDMKLTLGGIRGKLALNDLSVPESLPGQQLTIDTIRADRFVFKDAALRYSLEDGKHLLLENARFGWCNGLVSTESVRIPPPDDTVSLILYCDRLELTRLLEQIGAFRAQGEGTLSGRIPVLFKDGEISFDNGFLFSTPGIGGRVNIDNTDKLLSGIPMDSPQFVQLDLAREALKEFDYEWATLKLNTLHDTLLVNMALDGKPAGLLPFEYRKELGGFMRVDSQSPGSRFQGIKLDVNLKLPFNQVLKFGNKIKNMME